jgi:hypothetical protein
MVKDISLICLACVVILFVNVLFDVILIVSALTVHVHVVYLLLVY